MRWHGAGFLGEHCAGLASGGSLRWILQSRQSELDTKGVTAVLTAERLAGTPLMQVLVVVALGVDQGILKLVMPKELCLKYLKALEDVTS